jgi:hypothetical protein
LQLDNTRFEGGGEVMLQSLSSSESRLGEAFHHDCYHDIDKQQAWVDGTVPDTMAFRHCAALMQQTRDQMEVSGVWDREGIMEGWTGECIPQQRRRTGQDKKPL